MLGFFVMLELVEVELPGGRSTSENHKAHMSEYLRKNINIREGEDVLRIIRRYMLTFFWSYMMLLLFIVGPFFFIVPLFRWGMSGMIVFFGTLFIGVFLALRTFMTWFFNALVVTTERVIDIDQRGFFHRTTSEIPYEDIADVMARRKGILQTIFRYGDIIITTDGEVQYIVRSVKRPERVQDIILKCVEMHSEKQSASETSVPPPRENEVKSADDDVEIVEILRALRKKVGDDNFHELIHKAEE